MKAVVYSSPKSFSVVDIDMPAYGDRQVLIKVKSCGICRTDVHIHNGHFISRFPLTPGHEFSGVVEKTGSLVTCFKPGDRVVADNTVLCGECYYCRKNQPLFCENFYSLGVNGPGGFAEYVTVNQDKVFPISDDLSFDEAAFCEPTACAVHGMDVMDIKCGDDVLIFGSGPTGIILTQLLKYGGAANVVVVAPSKFKLDILNSYGVMDTVRMDRNDYSVHEKLIKAKYPKGFNVIIDATGSPEVIEQCIGFAAKKAKIIIYGVSEQTDVVRISPYEIFEKEISIIGSFAQTHCFDRAIKYLEKRIVRVDHLISHSFALKDYEKALATVMNGKDSIKVMINP